MTGVLIYTSIFCEKMHAIFLVYAISGRVGSVESPASAIGTLRVICSFVDCEQSRFIDNIFTYDYFLRHLDFLSVCLFVSPSFFVCVLGGKRFGLSTQKSVASIVGAEHLP